MAIKMHIVGFLQVQLQLAAQPALPNNVNKHHAFPDGHKIPKPVISELCVVPLQPQLQPDPARAPKPVPRALIHVLTILSPFVIHADTQGPQLVAEVIIPAKQSAELPHA